MQRIQADLRSGTILADISTNLQQAPAGHAYVLIAPHSKTAACRAFNPSDRAVSPMTGYHSPCYQTSEQHGIHSIRAPAQPCRPVVCSMTQEPSHSRKTSSRMLLFSTNTLTVWHPHSSEVHVPCSLATTAAVGVHDAMLQIHALAQSLSPCSIWLQGWYVLSAQAQRLRGLIYSTCCNLASKIG